MFEYDFTVEGSLTPGSHVFAVTTVGAQPHEMFMLRAPGPVTEEQVAQVLEMEMQGGTPAPDVGGAESGGILPGCLHDTTVDGEDWMDPG